ncbi:hypothetical protein M011DRAFT_504426 [Sporormia fimetaria CBS 119925]|uniref:Pre-rrna processing protein n=1 Tax=Sporormia fimetaria CBS 119925 TaxID=1340428 RepID=A0A6A6V7Y2_9PLEO|nr:hypothetical protein M011DRAFT_504426 [Sporormia fimetaria CBS 119925]
MDYSTAASSRPASQKSGRSSRSRLSELSTQATEQTPLLAQDDRERDEEESEESGTPEENPNDKISLWRKRWPSILALLLLCGGVVCIMLGFLATEGIEEYAMQAADFQPTKLALDDMTKTGVRVHIEGDFRMDASRVKKASVRRLGRFGTWMAREVESGPTDVEIYLPEYDDALLGRARVPGVKVNVRNGHTTHVSVSADAEPASFDVIRDLARDWMDGRLEKIRLRGQAHVPLKSGLLRLGTQTVEQVLLFQGGDVPALPAYNITKVNLREAKKGEKGVGADVSVAMKNDFPVQLTLPPVAVDVLVGGCQPSDQLIMVGTAETTKLDVEPRTDITVKVTGHVTELPDELTAQCPNSAKSPLDSFIGDYMHGQESTIYVKCCNFPDPSTPGWASDLLKDITVPVPFAGRDMGNLIKNFSLSDVNFAFPSSTDPDDPESNPTISAVIKVDIGLPEEMNFPLDVKHIKADADVYYKKKKFGKLDLKRWQKANSTRIDVHGKEGPSLLVQADIEKAPLEVLDGQALFEIGRKMMMGETIMLDIKAGVGVEVDTPMGQFAIRDIPAEGVVPVKRIATDELTSVLAAIDHGKGGGRGPGSFGLGMGNLSIVETTRTALVIQAHLNFTNPTNYSATVPYVNVNVLVNDTVMGQAVAENLNVRPGNNTNVIGKVIWDPYTHSGEKGKAIGAEFLSQYISGYNTTLTVRAHNATIPANPLLGSVLSNFPLTFPMPSLSHSSPNSTKGHFIQSATMHLLTSTAVFSLSSPFTTTTMYITSLNATSYYEGHQAGRIQYDFPFAVPPGVSESPRLPVDWSFGGLGYEAIRKALGGSLTMTAVGDVGIRIGDWRERVWYRGGKIGAKVRL